MITGIERIKNIIFDFGGVIINLDRQLSIDEFRNIGISDFKEVYEYAVRTKLFENFEKGDISPAFFRDELRKFIPGRITDKEIDRAWNAILLDIPPERIKLLERLKLLYRTFLLSNTNIIHYEYYTQNLQKHYGYHDFSQLFEKDYFSHRIGLVKPGKEIFDFVLKESGLDPHETLFIDDLAENIEGAKRAGLSTCLLPPQQSITSLF